MGSNDIPTEGYSIDNVFDGGFSSTEADKTKKYQLYLEERFADHLSNLSNVESATVSLSMPADDGTIISKDEETYASVILTLDGEMDEDQAAGIAQYIATEVGNNTTDRITILDSDTNMLFPAETAVQTLARRAVIFRTERKWKISSRAMSKMLLWERMSMIT